MPTMTFTTGNDTYTVPAGPGTYDLTFLAGDDTLTVDGGDSVIAHMDDDNDLVTVNALNGGGTATIYGGLGDETYVVKVGGVTLVENSGQGTDLVKSSISWVLGANFENLTLTGSSLIDGTGNSIANTIAGNGAANTLDGGAGNDTLLGNGGDDILIGGAGLDKLNGGAGADSMAGGLNSDTYYVDNALDTVTENSGEGTDTVISTIDYTLGANVEKLTLSGTAVNATGNALANTIRGDDLDNMIDGGAGADAMSGGKGNDTYVADNVLDRAFEAVGEGIDTVLSSVTFKLGSNVENLTLTGVAAVNGNGNVLDNVIIGNDAANTLYGSAGSDTLTGAGGNDILNGGTGADAMAGGTGNDTYIVDNAGDSIVENAGEGTDLVKSTVSWTLGADIENLTLLGALAINGTGNALDNVISGNNGINVLDGGDGNDTLWGYGGNDTLIGGAGNDVLNGGTGADTMSGGIGNDSYYVDNVGDAVTENAAEGTDAVFSTISYTLGAEVEKLTLSGSSAISGTGNALNNVITGNSAGNVLLGGDGNDKIDGAAGDDSITGGLGLDTMTGGTNSDMFVYTDIGESLVGSADLITDFTSTSGAGTDDDKLDLSGIDADTGTAGDQAFTWGSVTPTAHGIWIPFPGTAPDGSLILYGDVNGDTTPDFEIHLKLTSGQLFTDDIIF
jgi:Ca2+-binding RTX toxin-like protein